jgi:hypothetical protein
VGGTCGTLGGGERCNRVLVGMPEGRKSLGWNDKIKMDFREIGIDGANWIRLNLGRDQRGAFLNMIMNLRVP